MLNGAKPGQKGGASTTALSCCSRTSILQEILTDHWKSPLQHSLLKARPWHPPPHPHHNDTTDFLCGWSNTTSTHWTTYHTLTAPPLAECVRHSTWVLDIINRLKEGRPMEGVWQSQRSHLVMGRRVRWGHAHHDSHDVNRFSWQISRPCPQHAMRLGTPTNQIRSHCILMGDFHILPTNFYMYGFLAPRLLRL